MMEKEEIRPKWNCIYGTCRMVNICKSYHCVGFILWQDGWKINSLGHLITKGPEDDE